MAVAKWVILRIRLLGLLFKRLFSGGFKRVVLRFSWEIIQTAVSFVVAIFVILFLPARKISVYEGAVVITVFFLKRQYWGGITFGCLILGGKDVYAGYRSSLFLHEFGHVLQSRVSGPVFLFKYGLPSLVSAMRKGEHARHPVEQDANIRSSAYFLAKKDFGNYPFHFNPVYEGYRLLPLRWWEYIPLAGLPVMTLAFYLLLPRKPV